MKNKSVTRISLRRYPGGTIILQVKDVWYELTKEEVEQIRKALCTREAEEEEKEVPR